MSPVFHLFLTHVGCLRQNFQFTIQRNISFSEIIKNCSSWILIRQQLSNERCFIHVTHCTSLLMWEMETISFKWWIMDNFLQTLHPQLSHPVSHYCHCHTIPCTHTKKNHCNCSIPEFCNKRRVHPYDTVLFPTLEINLSFSNNSQGGSLLLYS